MSRQTTRTKVIDNLLNVAGADVLAGYKIVYRDENPSAISYYGLTDTEGNWIIQRETPVGTLTTTDFARGTTNFDANWTGRVGLTYVKFYQLF